MNNTPAPKSTDGDTTSDTRSRSRKCGQETRERLLKAALELLWKESYGAVSVDDICTEAKVRKGSFYHFFESKCDLTIEAIKNYAAISRPTLDGIFSPTKPPLVRLKDFCEMNIANQTKMAATIGHVCGCPFAALGCELSGTEETVRQAASELGAATVNYLESAINDAARMGEIEMCNSRARAEELYTVLIGAVTQARIRNDLGALSTLWTTMQHMLRVKDLG